MRQSTGTKSSTPDQPVAQDGFDTKSYLESLPACTAQDEFTVSPLPLDQFNSIAPLGTIEPSSNHVLPVDHLYVNLYRTGQPPIPVLAPGNVIIYRVSETTRFANSDHHVLFRDYALYLASCSQFNTSYGHIRTISDALVAKIATAQKDCQPEYNVGDFSALACSYYPKYQAKAGEQIGSLATGEKDPNFDISGIDYRHGPLQFANQDRYKGDQPYIACGLDFFTATLKATFYDRLGGGQAKRTVEPRCGTIAQDLSGTLQGNWFTEAGEWGNLEAAGKAIAFVHQNLDGVIAVVSLGREFGTVGKIDFMPKHDGTINRDFSEVKADGAIYCYQGNIPKDDQSLRGKVITQLTSTTTLKIEYQSGHCASAETFTSPKAYIR